MVGCEVELTLMCVVRDYHVHRDACAWPSLSNVRFVGLYTGRLTVFCQGSLGLKVAMMCFFALTRSKKYGRHTILTTTMYM